MTQKLTLPRAAAGLTLLLLAACQSDSPVSPAAARSTIETTVVFNTVDGNNQTGAAGLELPVALIAQLTDGSGEPRAGYMVNWVVLEGGGVMWAANGVTDEEGKATNRWTLGPHPGRNAVEVRSISAVSGEERVHGTFIAIGVTPP